jgi:hypothetical protein
MASPGCRPAAKGGRSFAKMAAYYRLSVHFHGVNWQPLREGAALTGCGFRHHSLGCHGELDRNTPARGVCVSATYHGCL